MTRLLAPACDVLGCVADSATLIDAAFKLRPGVVLLDFSLPGGLSGFDICRRLRSMTPEVKVVALTALDDDDVRQGAFEAGFSGFVWKLKAATELLSTIQAVVEGTDRSAEDDTA
jgi:DNA-binding NarL/FixJ family response regulator